MLSINNSRKFANFINDSSNFGDEDVERTEADLIRILFSTITKAYFNGQASLHVHVRVRLIGESVSDNLCFLLERKPTCTDSLFKQDCVRIPPDSINNVSNIRQLWQEGTVLVSIGELFNDSEWAFEKLSSFVRLRSLNDCPRISINNYPVEHTELWISLSGLDFIKEIFLTIIDRELIPPTWFMTVSKDKLTDQMVEGASKVMNDISSNHRKADVGFWERFNCYNVPHAITPYIEHTGIGLRFNPSVKFRYEASAVFLGPHELSPYSSEVCNSNSHMLYYPYGEANGRKETKDSQRARDTRAHKERVPRQSKKGSKVEQVNASQLGEVKTQTLHDLRCGGYNAKLNVGQFPISLPSPYSPIYPV